MIHWARRGVVHDKPVWTYGNLNQVGKSLSAVERFRNYYEKYKGKAPFGGFYFPFREAAVLLDLDLVKLVMVKDFNNFAHRGNYSNERDDPISAHLFNLDGHAWRDMRNKLTPTFTSLKMHQMLPIVLEIAERFMLVMQKELDKHKGEEESPVEVKDLLARFTTDIIGSCAFGLDCNSLNDPKVEFRRMGNKTFTERRHGRIVFSFIQSFPKFAKWLKLKTVRDDVSAFFRRVVRETLDYRDRNHVQRKDFFNLLMELRKDPNGGLSFNQIAAQAFVFFLGGFETSSSTMGFALHLLALHPEIQERGREEVQQVLSKHKQLNYEALKELKYIKQIMYETLRKYSIASILLRKTLEDYPVPGTSYVLEAGTPIVIPVDAIHHDPDVYPEPDKFDPERFTPEAMEQRHAAAFLGFGAGPRNCIGLRFGEMQTLVGLAMLLKNFKFSPAKATEIPLQINKSSVFLQSKGGIVLNVERV
ncbi:maker27 [Drosophila busckii]|uniref:Maker27 n=1 Tax=Drosophila busckii TaxID=30019 RepID=A0A0M3QUN2_DROBS|nr:maker27 [Drosophila busckii]